MSKTLAKVTELCDDKVTVSTLDNTFQHTYSRDEFDHYWKPTAQEDIYEMVLNDEEEDMVNDIQRQIKWITPLMPLILMAKAHPSAKGNAYVGRIIKLYLKTFPGYTVEDFATLVQSMINLLTKGKLE